MSKMIVQAVLKRGLFFGALTLTMAGCSNLPSFGPSGEAINSSSVDVVTKSDEVLPFQIVDVSAETLPSQTASTNTFPPAFRDLGFRTKDKTVEVGDQLKIGIWEVADDGLFATAGRRETVLEVVVSNSGNITVPYTDPIAVRGLTAAQLRTLLLERYQGQAIEPEIAVAITQSRAATVLGDVKRPGRATIPSNGIRLLELLAQVGGTIQASWEVKVSIQRAYATAALPLSDILASPSNNIVVLPGDVINVVHAPRRFAVYGAINQPGNIEIPVQEAHLSYLLAAVGGLNDRVAQAKSIFVFRRASGSNVSEFPSATVYRFDFSRPDAFLLASTFRLQTNDITYVASANAADFQKFVSIILSPVSGTTSKILSLGN